MNRPIYDPMVAAKVTYNNLPPNIKNQFTENDIYTIDIK